MHIDGMLQSDPDGQCHAEDEVEESFVRDCEYDEGWRECKEKNHQTMHVMAVRIEPVKERQQERSN